MNETEETVTREIRPLQDRVLAERLPEVAEIGGIAIPDHVRERPLEAVVLATGPDVAGVLKVGDHVLIGKYSGSAIPIDGREYLLLRLDEIFATITAPVATN